MSIYVKKEILFPKAIVGKECVFNEENLLKDKNLQVVMLVPDTVLIENGGWIILDFGKEIYGNLRLLTDETEEKLANIRVSLGESVAEVCSTADENVAKNNHSIQDDIYTSSFYSDFTTPKTGFRFAKIEAVKGWVKFSSIVAEAEMPDLERKGYFRSNDEVLNRIAETAVYTATLCVQNGVIWDGIKRDRLVWMGDMHPEILTLSQAYGAIEQIKNSLDYIKYYVPQAWANWQPAYSAWWLICFAEYYMISDDQDYIKENLYLVQSILEAFDAIIFEDGSVSYDNSSLSLYEDSEFFFDWPTAFEEERKMGWASLVKFAMDKTIWLLKEFGQEYALAQKLSSYIAKNPMYNTDYKQVEAFNYLAGRKGKEIVETLVKDGGRGLTSFICYYILTAAAECGGEEKTLHMLKEYYGGMLDLGATTFWEDFDVEWLKDKPQGLTEMPTDKKNIHRDYGKYCYKGLRHSLCNGWSAGVYAFLTRTVLGICPIEAGYKKIKIKPHMIGLKEVEGCVPTPYGEIYVNHYVQDGKIISKVQVPDGVEICK